MAKINLSNEAIREYQSIYLKEFKKEISFEEAKLQAENFINLIKLISKPIEDQV